MQRHNEEKTAFFRQGVGVGGGLPPFLESSSVASDPRAQPNLLFFPAIKEKQNGTWHLSPRGLLFRFPPATEDAGQDLFFLPEESSAPQR